MINFGNTNTCKDAANLVLHVARLKAQHYARKSCTKTKTSPNYSKMEILRRFRPNFLKVKKNCYVLSFFECLGPCQADSCPETHPISTVSRIKPRKIHYGRHFCHPRCFLLHKSKVRLPRYCGKRATSFPGSSLCRYFLEVERGPWERGCSKELRYVHVSRP